MMERLRAAALLSSFCSVALVMGVAPAPATFLANEGQWLPAILFKGRSATANVSFLRDGISFSQVAPEDEEEEHEEPHVDHHAAPEFQVWNMTFAGIDAGVRIAGERGRKSVTNYLSGSDPSKWVVHPMEYERVIYQGIYPGIDVHFYGAGLDLEYDHVLHPGADIRMIRTVYAGIESLALNVSGDLVITTAMGTQIQRAPVAWQVIDGAQHAVPVDFVLYNDSTFGFTVRGGYDRTRTLVIDPLFELVWASYTRALGSGNNINYCFANAMDAQGNVYLTGMVDGTFPITPGSYSGPGNIYPEIFVAKFSSDGTTLLYSTYLPGNSSEFGTSIAVDALGRAYITGVVDLNFTGQTNFPSTPNAYQPVHADGPDAILTVLDPTGSSLVYATFLGEGGETGYGVALGPTGIAYVTGTTSYIGYPEVNAATYPHGDKDVFVAKFDIAQSGAASLLYSVRVGAGSFNYCTAHGLAVDAAGNAYVTGSVGVGFGSSVFPVTAGAYNTTYNSGQDGGAAYLLKLGNTLPVPITYCTYLGPGMGASVDVGSTGEAFVAGTTATPTFPITAGALQPTYGLGNNDAFALKMNAAGSALLYSTFLGGPGNDRATDIAVNGSGEAYVSGIARDGFPTSPGALQPALAGGLYQDLWVVQLNSTGTAYGCGGSTYFGGTSDEYYGSFYDYFAPSLALHDSGGQDTLSIAATSHSQDFPTTPGVYEPTKVNGIADQPVFFKLTCASMPMAPVAGFNADVLPTCTGALVDFDDTSTHSADTWTWSFPGGAPTSSTAQNPQDIIYPAAGNYTVTLIACNAIGCDTVVQQITVSLAPAATVDLGNDTTLCDGSTATLIADPGFATYIWELNGSLLSDGTSSITVSDPGVYTVSVADSAGCSGVDTVLVEVLNTPLRTSAMRWKKRPAPLPRLNFHRAAGGTAYLWAFRGIAPWPADRNNNIPMRCRAPTPFRSP
ncbi:MAG: PKD domain-containing protein [Flavobacteriales bacterium]|nr:PKD domain-containing protein [Flavobacteriales bacterium]